MSTIVHSNRILPRQNKLGFQITFLLLVLVCISEWYGVYSDLGYSNNRTLHILTKFVEFSIAPIIAFTVGIAVGSFKKTKLLLIPLIIHIFLEIINLYYGFIFTINANNIYERSNFYMIYVLAYLIGITSLFISLYYLKEAYHNTSHSTLVTMFTLLIVTIGIQMFNENMHIVWTFVTVATIQLYCYYSALVNQVDSLTSLLNRKCYETEISDINSDCIILYFDVDKFKTINDTYGHSFGDYCLKEVSKILNKAYGKYGCCYRIGGDEFCVILESRLDSIDKLNENLFNLVNMYQSLEPRLPSVSIGYAVHSKYSNIEDTINKADRNMYNFKNRTSGSLTE